MNPTTHTLGDLFLQLGLPGAPADIDRFVASHRPLADGVALSDAPFWSRGQAQLLCEALAADADWAELVDELSLMLRA